MFSQGVPMCRELLANTARSCRQVWNTNQNTDTGCSLWSRCARKMCNMCLQYRRLYTVYNHSLFNCFTRLPFEKLFYIGLGLLLFFYLCYTILMVLNASNVFNPEPLYTGTVWPHKPVTPNREYYYCMVKA